jgi:hypothetical protein
MSGSITNNAALAVLPGKKLAIWRRAANMLVLHFGKVTRAAEGSWGEYALHVQCPWRLIMDGVIFAGQSDLYNPRERTPNFDWDYWYKKSDWPDNLLEHKIRSILKGYDPATRSIENATEGFVVEKAEATEIGDARIYFSGGCVWECFPNGCEGEHWRLLDFRGAPEEHEKRRHFVVSGEYAPANMMV